MSGEMARLVWMALTRRASGPAYLVHEVTRRSRRTDGDRSTGASTGAAGELTLDEITVLARRLPRTVAWLRLEGDEPFARPDLAEIVAAYAGPGGVRDIEIATDGWLTDPIVATVARALRENPRLRLAVAVALDGVPEVHDRMRGRPGACDRARATILALRRIETGEPRLRCHVSITVSAENRDTVGDLLAFLTRELEAPAVTCSLAPGVVSEAGVDPLTLQQFDRFTRMVTLARDAGELARGRGPFGAFADAMADLAWSRPARRANGGAARGACCAGRMAGFLGSDGTLRACPSRPSSLGNARAIGFDLGRLWKGDAARAERARVLAGGCACTEQGFLTCDAAFDARAYPELIVRAMKKAMVRARARHSKRLPSELYDTAYLMSQLLEGYQEFREGRLSVVKAREIEMLALEPGMSVLEVGFGRGEFLYHCARRGAKVAGIDYSRDAFEIARTLFQDVPEADIRVADCRDLPFGSQSFDRVFSGDVIEHVNYEDGVLMLQEMYRVLKPGGFLLLHTTPNTVFTRFVYPLARPALRLIDAETIKAVEHHLAVGKQVHVHEYNLFSLRKAARDAGLTGARVWIDADVLRSGKHPYTAAFGRNLLVRWAASLSGTAPVRFLLGNDLYLKYARPPG
jgi:ubiquinone/menaquinone biosynthesis C-methylase UbiE/MoaA/NifB/PqqE/SkfB family radical SAM enzyme